MEDIKQETLIAEKEHRNYEEGSVLRDLALAGVKIKILNVAEATELGLVFGVNSVLLQGKKVISVSEKNPLGIKRLGKVDFLMNFCKGYVGVTTHSK